MSDDRTERVEGPAPGHPANVPVFSEARLAGFTWSRLANRRFTNQFFPSLKSRLTPASGRFPCVYLGASVETTVAELWGDRWSIAKKRGRDVFVILKEKADELGFLQAGPLPKLALCDFTDADTRLALGLDAAAIFTPDLAVPQAWAEMIATHPNTYDGIVYRSRHTDETCAVLWSRPGIREMHTEIAFSDAGPFLESAAAYSVAGKIGIKLSWPSGVPA
jgi:RES domain-containing protein